MSLRWGKLCLNYLVTLAPNTLPRMWHEPTEQLNKGLKHKYNVSFLSLSLFSAGMWDSWIKPLHTYFLSTRAGDGAIGGCLLSRPRLPSVTWTLPGVLRHAYKIVFTIWQDNWPLGYWIEAIWKEGEMSTSGLFQNIDWWKPKKVKKEGDDHKPNWGKFN